MPIHGMSRSMIFYFRNEKPFFPFKRLSIVTTFEIKMKIKMLFVALSIGCAGYAQQDTRVSTLSFVQILNDSKDEAVFYFENNWKVLREKALEKDYISSFEFLELTHNDESSYNFVLITTYSDMAQFDLREEHFTELIEEKGELKLLNNKKPAEFRKTLFTNKMVKHLN